MSSKQVSLLENISVRVLIGIGSVAAVIFLDSTFRIK